MITSVRNATHNQSTVSLSFPLRLQFLILTLNTATA